jgi:hypothetical protein
MTQAVSQLLTFDDFIAQYGDRDAAKQPLRERYELIDGELIDMEPTRPHEEVAAFILRKVNVEIDRLSVSWFTPTRCLIKPLGTTTAFRPDVFILDKAALKNEPLWQDEPVITWVFRTYRAKLLIKVDKFALKSRLTAAYSLIFRNLTVMQSIMAILIDQQRSQAYFSTNLARALYARTRNGSKSEIVSDRNNSIINDHIFDYLLYSFPILCQYSATLFSHFSQYSCMTSGSNQNISASLYGIATTNKARSILIP